MKGKRYHRLRPLAEGAAALALAQGLDFLRFFTLPEGGDVSLAMAPLILYALRWGLKKGALLGLAFGILGAVLRWDWIPVGLGRAIGCAALGTAGLFRGQKQPKGALFGALLGVPLCALFRALTGICLLPEFTPERFLNLRMVSPTPFYVLHELLWASLNLLPTLLLLLPASLLLRGFLAGDDLEDLEDSEDTEDAGDGEDA